MPYKDKEIKKIKDREYGRTHHNAYRIWWLEVKRQFSCKICGESHPACLDFHHRDPKQKEYNISFMVVNRMKRELVLIELQKCDALCANCHRKLHFKDV